MAHHRESRALPRMCVRSGSQPSRLARARDARKANQTKFHRFWPALPAPIPDLRLGRCPPPLVRVVGMHSLEAEQALRASLARTLGSWRWAGRPPEARSVGGRVAGVARACGRSSDKCGRTSAKARALELRPRKPPGRFPQRVLSTLRDGRRAAAHLRGRSCGAGCDLACLASQCAARAGWGACSCAPARAKGTRVFPVSHLLYMLGAQIRFLRMDMQQPRAMRAAFAGSWCVSRERGPSSQWPAQLDQWHAAMRCAMWRRLAGSLAMNAGCVDSCAARGSAALRWHGTVETARTQL